MSHVTIRFDDLKVVRVFLQRLFCLRKPCAVLLRLVSPQTVCRRLTAVVLHFIAQQHIDRRVEQV